MFTDLSQYQEQPTQLGAWYNSLSDLTEDIRTGARWLTGQTNTIRNAGQTATNVANNVQNATAWRLDGNTVVLAGAVLLGLMLMNRRR